MDVGYQAIFKDRPSKSIIEYINLMEVLCSLIRETSNLNKVDFGNIEKV